MENKKIQKQGKNKKSSGKELIAVIRISGDVKVRKKVAETLNRLRLRRKYSCILMNSDSVNKNMIEKIKYYVSYGKISKETLKKLLKERGKSMKSEKKKLKIDFDKIAEEIINGKKLKEVGLKPFFRLHPPRKGINSKLQYPKGVLGENKEINKLIERML